MTNFLKKVSGDIIAIVFFLLLSLTYFFTPATQGMVLSGDDNTGGIGAGQELGNYVQRTGEMTRWTNSLFSGMPTYQISPSYGSRSLLDIFRNVYELGLSGAMMYVFILLLGFYILMRTLKQKPLISVVGAILWAFSSYFFIIIAAGHIWKVLTLAFIPPTIAGMILCYRGKYLLGGAVTALFLAFQILSNHLQMTYYFMSVMAFMFIAYLIDAAQKKTWEKFVKSTVTLIIAAVLACAANLSNLYHTYEYSKQSMRGDVTLSSTTGEQKGGLSKSYITQWSYGIGETWTLLVPNAKGGASVPIAMNETAMKKADPQYGQLYNQFGQYWGEQPGTSGPVYVGAFVMFLFILGLFIIKGPMKWCLFAVTVLSVMLSWGHNFMPLTDFFIDNVPMYNKFRTVASILVIAEFTIPLLAMMALAKIVEEPKILTNRPWKLYTSLALTGGIALLFAIMPTAVFSSFVSNSENTQLREALRDNPNVANAILANLADMRIAIFTADAWRSFFIILIGFAIVMAYRFKKMKATSMVVMIGLLCLIDMFDVNKRYLNDDNFVEPEMNHSGFVKTTADEFILQDKSLDYRVLNLSRNTFNENETSYWHKSIGGYHAAKLGRYQDLINICISPEINAFREAIGRTAGKFTPEELDSICPVLNMLNTKYFILPTQNEPVPLQNTAAMGNAWFVDNVEFADNANDEIQALHQINLHKTAIADASFKSLFANAESAKEDTTRNVQLVKYEPNELQYSVSSEKGGVVVFSEIYYPGWTMEIDGKTTEIGRADYTLRAAYIPAGEHQVVMTFKPKSIKITEAIAYTAIILLILCIVGVTLYNIRKKK